MSFTSYIILLHALLKQTIRHLTIGPSHCIIYYFTHLSNSAHGITKYCDLVLIIFYTPLKLPIRLLTSLPCFVPIIFYTHLKLYNDNDIRRKSFIAISFHTHLKLPSTIPVAIRHFVPITFYTHLKHMNNLLYNLFCTRHILHTSQTDAQQMQTSFPFCTHHILHTSQTLGGVVISLLIVLYPSYSTHLSNFHNMGHDNEMVLYPSYSTYISNV